MFLKDLFWSILLFAVFTALLAIPNNYPHEPSWWLAATITAFWGTFGAVVMTPAAREHVRGWRR